MNKEPEKKIDPHLNNLVFSIYNFAKSRIKMAEISKIKDTKGAAISVEILKMLKRKIGANLTADEDKLISVLIADLQGKPEEQPSPDASVKRISMIEEQEDLLEHQQARAYKFSSTVDEAFVMVNIKDTIVQLMLGDLTVHPVEAVVSPDTTDLWMEQGVAAVIRLKGGDSIRKESRKDGSINIGEVRVTQAGDLAQKYIFHTAIITPKSETNRDNLREALGNILKKSEELGVKSIAIPALGMASSRFPYDAMAKIMIQTLFDYFVEKQNSCVKLAVISLFNKEAYGFFKEQFKIVSEANYLKVEESH